MRKAPVYSAYRPQHEIHENYQTSGYHSYEGRDILLPGETVEVKAWLITPQFYPHCIWEGRELRILEGSKHVGTLLVTKLFNPLLRVSPEDYKSIWVRPSGVNDEVIYDGWENT